MAERKRIFKKETIENFLKSDDIYMIIDWEQLGYSNLKNAYLCTKNNLIHYDYPCTCHMRNRKIYIVKDGYKLRKIKEQICVTKI